MFDNIADLMNVLGDLAFSGLPRDTKVFIFHGYLKNEGNPPEVVLGVDVYISHQVINDDMDYDDIGWANFSTLSNPTVLDDITAIMLFPGENK